MALVLEVVVLGFPWLEHRDGRIGLAAYPLRRTVSNQGVHLLLSSASASLVGWRRWAEGAPFSSGGGLGGECYVSMLRLLS